jgi:hypothetical protein
MPSLDLIFATVVGVLAGVAVVGALLYAISWEIFAFRRLLERHRRPDPDAEFWAQQRVLSRPK